jgi:hypothetical protein
MKEFIIEEIYQNEDQEIREQKILELLVKYIKDQMTVIQSTDALHNTPKQFL